MILEETGSLEKWWNGGPNTYLILKEDTNIEQFNDKIEGYIKSKIEWSKVTLFVRPHSDAYLYGKYENRIQAGGRIEYVRLFSIIAFFILLIACINFMNLSTAKASRSAKEIGIKKVIGAQRKTLIFQYLGESILMAFLSLLAAILIAGLFLPQFNEITGKHLTLNFDINLVLSVLGITLFTGFIAGSFPALYLSGFKPVIGLKGKFNNSAGTFWVRKGLVIFQFSLSVVMIVSVLVVYQQMELIQTKKPGV